MPGTISNNHVDDPQGQLKNTITILYATDSGNSQDLANLLAVRLRRLTVSNTITNTLKDDQNPDSFKPIANIVVSSMDEYLSDFVDVLNTPNDPSKTNLLFCLVSTAGQGEMPRTATRFWKFLLRRNLPKNLLSRFRFSTLGLGDSSYPRYNWAVRKFHTRLLQLGAQDLANVKNHVTNSDNVDSTVKEPVIERAEADEQDPDHPPDQVFSEWQKKILGYLDSMKEFQDPDTGVGLLNDIPDSVLLPPIDPITVEEGLDEKDKHSVLEQALTRLPEQNSKTDANQLTFANVSSIYRTTSDSHFQDVQAIVLDFPISEDKPDSYMSYEPGDTVALYPTNDPEMVDDVLEHLGWSLVADKPLKVTDSLVQRIVNDGVTIYPNKSGSLPKLVQPVTLRTLFTHHFDINAVPRRSFFASIYRFSILRDDDDPALSREREKLYEFGFTSDEDLLQDLYNYANRPRRSIAETIQEFHTLGNKNVPIEYFAEIFPILRPRLFSIATSDSGIVSVKNGNGEITKVRRLELCIALVKYQTILRKIRVGTCSRWLKEDVAPAVNSCNDKKERKVLVSLQRNNLLKAASFPSSLNTILQPTEPTKPQPLVIIATGTGVAPVRSLIQYYFDPLIEHHSKNKDTIDNSQITQLLRNVPDIHLFFGVRNFANDFHFREDWYQLLSHPLTSQKFHMYCAFSRDSQSQPSSSKVAQDTQVSQNSAAATASLTSFVTFKNFTYSTGVHIQALLYDARSNLSNLLLNKSASIYICGAAGKFPVETRRALVTALSDEKTEREKKPEKNENSEDTQTSESNETTEESQDTNINEEWAQEIVKQMEKSGKIVQETW